jgi:hypothetical protein
MIEIILAVILTLQVIQLFIMFIIINELYHLNESQESNINQPELNSNINSTKQIISAKNIAKLRSQV